MCYPLALAVPQVCPPLNSSATASRVSTSLAPTTARPITSTARPTTSTTRPTTSTTRPTTSTTQPTTSTTQM
ncbi:unnamed protein product, partial [Rotaria sp. Silwood1]